MVEQQAAKLSDVLCYENKDEICTFCVILKREKHLTTIIIIIII